MAKISIVVPVLNEEAATPLFHEAIVAAFAAIPHEFEIVFVDDGSADRTWDVIRGLSGADRRVRGIRFSRNFGKEHALVAGMTAASGDAVVPMDVDLQDPPSVLPLFVQKWEEGFDVVVGVRARRDSDTRFKRITAGWFYRLYNRMSGLRLVENAGDFRLLDRSVVDALNSLPERVRFTKGLYSWVGFRQAVVEYDRPARVAGSTKFDGWKLWNFALDGITSFTSLPLRVWSYVGGCIALAGFLYALFLVLRTVVRGVDVPGYASLMVVTLCLGGLILLSLGVLGEYLGRVFEEVKGRPLYVERARTGFPEDGRKDDLRKDGKGARPGPEESCGGPEGDGRNQG